MWHCHPILISTLILFGLAGCAGKQPPSTQPILQAVDLDYGVYLARIDIHTTISPEGFLQSVRTENKRYAPNDINNGKERTELRQGHLTSNQIADLARLFQTAIQVPADKSATVADGPYVHLRYGTTVLTNGNENMDAVRVLVDRIEAITATMTDRTGHAAP